MPPNIEMAVSIRDYIKIFEPSFAARLEALKETPRKFNFFRGRTIKVQIFHVYRKYVPLYG